MLFRSASPTAITTSVDAALGVDGLGEFYDTSADAQRFYRILELPLTETRDTDGDGMPDTYENQFPLALSPNNPNDGALDYDGDGLTNFQEYLAGTNPQSAASRLFLDGTFASVGRIRLQFNAVANVAYEFQSRVSLSTGVWLNLVSVPAAPSNRTITITNTATPMKYYRVVVP